MRKGKVFYKNYLAGIITKNNDGEYVFQYDDHYVKNKPGALELIEQSFLSSEMKNNYKALIEERYIQLELF